MKKLCECGCGLEVSPGCRFRRGHNLRVNNPAKDPDFTQKIRKTRKINKEIKEGKRPAPKLPFCACGCGGRVSKPGNKYIKYHYMKVNHPFSGKTKENDERLRKAGEKQSKTKKAFYTTEEGQRWIDENFRGVNSPTYGKSSWRKGLTKETNETVRIAGEKCSETRKKKYANGEIKSWNKGETIETNETVKKSAEKLSKTKKEFFQTEEGKKVAKERGEERKVFFATEEGQKWLDNHNRGENSPTYGKEPWSKGLTKEDDDRLKISGEKISKIRIDYYQTEEGKLHAKNQSLNMREKMTKNWQYPDFIKMMTEAWNKKPTQLEKDIDSIVQPLFPNEYRYNGNYDLGISIDGKIPDFVNINGKKKAIDAYGDHWHEGEYPQIRIDLFKEYGWDLLVIWQHELRDRDAVIQKILKFHGIESDHVIPQKISDIQINSKDKNKKEEVV